MEYEMDANSVEEIKLLEKIFIIVEREGSRRVFVDADKIPAMK
jgi:hypothetical protein